MLLRRTPARVEREKEVDGVVTPDNIEKLVSKHDKTIGADGEEEFGGQPGALAIMARRRRRQNILPAFPNFPHKAADPPRLSIVGSPITWPTSCKRYAGA